MKHLYLVRIGHFHYPSHILLIFKDYIMAREFALSLINDLMNQEFKEWHFEESIEKFHAKNDDLHIWIDIERDLYIDSNHLFLSLLDSIKDPKDFVDFPWVRKWKEENIKILLDPKKRAFRIGDIIVIKSGLWKGAVGKILEIRDNEFKYRVQIPDGVFDFKDHEIELLK